ncbi:MAG: acetyltransferase [Mycobacterium sp.]
MSARICPLRLEAFEQLPKHARQCVFWEVDPSTLRGDDHLADPEFEKEAWLSMVMLEWGSCAQVAIQGAPGPGEQDLDRAEVFNGEPCLGYVFYAPPSAVPRARKFPTGPVSADAVLLTSLGMDSADDAERLSGGLITAVVGDLVRRGVRALEAFGRTPLVDDLDCGSESGGVPVELEAVVEVLGDCSAGQCIIDANLLSEMGFEIVAPHPYFPRLRLELEQGLGWKADVEAALERLLESARLQVPVGAGSAALAVPTPIRSSRDPGD